MLDYTTLRIVTVATGPILRAELIAVEDVSADGDAVVDHYLMEPGGEDDALVESLSTAYIMEVDSGEPSDAAVKWACREAGWPVTLTSTEEQQCAEEMCAYWQPKFDEARQELERWTRVRDGTAELEQLFNQE